ncbi:MAG: hypothetical protein AAB505_00695 [Patescibacteria group bacterium]
MGEKQRYDYRRSEIFGYSIRSRGITGEGLLKYLNENGFTLSGDVLRVLRSEDFCPTNGVGYAVDIVTACGLSLPKESFSFDDVILLTKNQKNRKPLPLEAACYLRLEISNESLLKCGLSRIVVVNENPLHLLVIDGREGAESMTVSLGSFDHDDQNRVAFAFLSR